MIRPGFDVLTRWAVLAVVGCASLACGGSDGSGATPSPTPTPTGSTPTPTASAISGCGQSSDIIQSTTWTKCLEGKTFKGHDPLDAKTACQVRFLAGSRVELAHGATTYASADPASWGSGLYTNKQQGPSANDRQFIASLDGATAVENRLHAIKLQIVTGMLESTFDDTLEGTVFTTGMVRTTFNCKLDNI